MKRLVLLALLPILTLLAAPALGQDTESEASPPASPPLSSEVLAAMQIAGDVPRENARRAVERLRDTMLEMGRFESLDDTGSVAALVRLAITTVSVGPGVTVAVTGIEPDPQNPTRAKDIHIAATVSVDGDAEVDRLMGAWPAADDGGIVFIRQIDTNIELCFQKVDFKEDFLKPDALQPFVSHAPDSAGGMELMLDLENLRRAWPQALANGPARRVVAVTGLANARKIHVHIPDSGAVRLAYSSRALPADQVTERTGPASAVDGQVGVRWPAVFDAGLRTYAVALDDAQREAFAKRFQEWMSINGGRLRGIVQAVEIAGEWSVTTVEDNGRRVEVSTPVREGIETVRLIEAVKATLANSGFEVEDKRGVLALPKSVASALGGESLAIEVDDSDEPVVLKITID